MKYLPSFIVILRFISLMSCKFLRQNFLFLPIFCYNPTAISKFNLLLHQATQLLHWWRNQRLSLSQGINLYEAYNTKATGSATTNGMGVANLHKRLATRSQARHDTGQDCSWTMFQTKLITLGHQLSHSMLYKYILSC